MRSGCSTRGSALGRYRIPLRRGARRLSQLCLFPRHKIATNSEKAWPRIARSSKTATKSMKPQMNTDKHRSVFICVHRWLHFVQFMQTKILASLPRIFGVVLRIARNSFEQFVKFVASLSGIQFFNRDYWARCILNTTHSDLRDGRTKLTSFPQPTLFQWITSAPTGRHLRWNGFCSSAVFTSNRMVCCCSGFLP